MRKSVSTFLKHFQYFTTTPVLLLLPFSSSVLISQPLFTSSDSRFSNSSKYFSQTLISSSSTILITAFALSSLLIAKASVIRSLNRPKSPSFSSCLPLYKPLVLTHLFNITLCTSINITRIFLLSRIFSPSGSFRFFNPTIQTVCGLVLYAFLANIILLCNLALVVAGMENCSGYKAIHKAYLVRKGRNSTVLVSAFATNLGLASVEALFRFRLVRSQHLNERPIISLSMSLEGILIAYLYSIIIVLDTIACYYFIKSCRSDSSAENPNGFSNQIELV